MKQIQNAACDPVGGLNTIDYIDAMELIADKLKNLVKAGTYNFIYNVDILETDEDNHPVTPNKS
jgi:phosphate:Na+ symporter